MDKRDILISVVIPIYNVEKYLCQCLDSVVNQTYRMLEIICVDDGSTDSCLSILKNYQKTDDRIIILERPHQNAGVARNAGLEIVTGEYVCFLDGDDYFDVEMVERMLESALRFGSDIVIAKADAYNNIDGLLYDLTGTLDEKMIGKAYTLKPIECECIFSLTAGWPWDKLFRTDMIRKNNLRFQEIQVSNDIGFVTVAQACARNISIVYDKLVFHRINVHGSIETNRGAKWECCFLAMQYTEMELKKRDLFAKFAKRFYALEVGYVISYIPFLESQDKAEKFYLKMKKNFIEIDNQYNIENDLVFFNDFFKRHVKEILELDFSEYCFFRCKDQEIINTFLEGSLKYYRRRENNCVGLVDDLKKVLAKKKWLLQMSCVPNGSKVILYGYGDMGQDFVYQIESGNSYELVAVADQNYANKQGQGFPIISPKRINEYEYDYIIIAVYDKKISSEIKGFLMSLGIEKEKIIWIDYDK